MRGSQGPRKRLARAAPDRCPLTLKSSDLVFYDHKEAILCGNAELTDVFVPGLR